MSIPTLAYSNEDHIYLPTARNILYVGGSGPGNYTTIQDAIDDAVSGDTVFVYDDSSPYIEQLLINKRINLVGENKNTTVIYGNTGMAVSIRSGGSYTNISGFNLINNGNNEVVSIDWVGSLIIQNNIISYGRKGFYTYHASNSIFRNNKIYSNQEDGLYMIYSSNNRIYNNSFFDNGVGIFSENSYHTNNNATIFNNLIFSNDGYGIVIKGSYNKIIGNIIMNNVNHGIYLTESEYAYTDYNIIKENHLINNSHGIFIQCPTYPPGLSCTNNLIHHNNFISNIVNAYDEDNNIWDNGYVYPCDPSIDGGNYWSDYTGHDFYSGPGQNISGSDGIGDTPYVIAGGSNQDNYPLMEYYYNGTNYPPNKPSINGPTTGEIEQKYYFTFILQSPEFEFLYYYIDWGDGTHEGWIGPYIPGEEINVSHTWHNIGSFYVKARVKDYFNAVSDWSDPLIIKISQEPPYQPTITGPTKGMVNQLCNYSLVGPDS